MTIRLDAALGQSCQAVLLNNSHDLVIAEGSEAQAIDTLVPGSSETFIIGFQIGESEEYKITSYTFTITKGVAS